VPLAEAPRSFEAPSGEDVTVVITLSEAAARLPHRDAAPE
jgi:hypothetical protein